ncbi:hypothetical protein [Lentzea nigeriaca]|nr:hypothetical protein [Lentzea nigeriaca]MBM7859464.1 hypothetical protein [Lentzea nigeriaca]
MGRFLGFLGAVALMLGFAVLSAPLANATVGARWQIAPYPSETGR